MMSQGRGDRVSLQKNNRHEFYKCYIDLCQFHKLYPAPVIHKATKHTNLNLCGDRVRSEDWQLISKALSTDQSLESIYIWSRYCRINPAFLNEDFKRKAMVKNIPPFLSPKILSSLVGSITKCLRKSKVLSILKLQFLPLLTHDSKLLSETVGYCTSLEHLSLSHCRIGDDVCVTLCRSLKACAKLKTLNLSGCSISSVGVCAIATLIKEHSLTSFSEVWSRTLRQKTEGIPETDEGLKRISLNQNPLIGDLGIDNLSMTLLDDTCVRAIDLQDCGMTNIGGEIIKCLLQVNKTLQIVDVRYNGNLEFSIFDDILNLLINNNPDLSQWEWMKMDPFITLKHQRLRKWFEYDRHFPFCKLNTMNSDSKSNEASRNHRLSQRNKTFGAASNFEVAQSPKRREGRKTEPKKDSSEEYILVEKSVLLDISATLQKINYFIRRLDLPQLISVLKDLKSETEQYESSASPDLKITKNEKTKITSRDENWSDTSETKNLDEIFKRPFKKTNSFYSSKNCSCCYDKISRDVQTQSDHSSNALKPSHSKTVKRQ